MEKMWEASRKRKSCILKACRECRRELEETQHLALLLQSLLHKLPGNDRSNELCHGDAPGEVFTPGPAGANRPPRPWAAAPPPSRPLSSSPSLASGTQHSLACTLSIEPQEEQPALRRVPPGTGPQDCLLSKSCLASLIAALPGPAHLHHCLSFFSWCWATAKATLSSTWAHGTCPQGHLPHQPPDTVFWAGPAHWQAEAGRGDHSVIHPDVQKLLEMLISEKVKQKMCQEKRQGGSFFQPVNTDHPRASLRNLLRLLGDKLTSARPLCSTKGKPEWLLGPQQPSIPKVLGNSSEHECSLLFWGLPSLHSESLVATAWVAKRSSSSWPWSIKFNEAATHVPDQSLQTLPPFLPYAQCPAQVPGFPPKPPPTSPSQVRVCGTTCSAPQKKAQSFLPKENQDLKWTLQKPQKWRKALDTKLQKAQEPVSLPTLSLPQGSQAPEAPQSASVPSGDSHSIELQKKPECHKSGASNRAERSKDPPHRAFRFLPSQGPLQPPSKLPRKLQGQAQDSHGHAQPTLPSAPTCGRNNAVQNTGPQPSGSPFNKSLGALKREDRRNVQQNASKDRKDASRGAGSSSRKVQGDEGAQSDNVGPDKYGSGGHFSRVPHQKVLQKGLQVHLSRKLGQINEGMIPVYVRRSWLTAKHALPRSNDHSQPTYLKYSKGLKRCVNTSQLLTFLDPRTHLLLEAHIRNYRLRHKWGQSLFPDLEPRSIGVGEAQAVPLPQPSFASSATCDSRVDFPAKVATSRQKVLGKIPGQKERTQTSSPSWQSPLPSIRLSACKEVQSSGTGILSDPSWPSDVTPTAQGVALPSTACTQQSSTVLRTERGSPESTPGQAMAKQDPREGTWKMAFTPILEIKLLPPVSAAKERKNPEVEEKQPAWEVTVGARMMENAQNINISLRTVGTQDPSNHSSPSNQAPNGRRKVDSHPGIDMRGDGENWSQDVSPGSLQDSHTERPLSTSTCPSQASLTSSQCTSLSNTPTPQFLCDHSVNGASSQGQQEPSMSGFQDTEKSSSKMSGPTDQCHNHRKPRPGDEEQTLAGEKPSHAYEQCPPEQVREVDTPGSQSSPHFPEKDQAPTESLVNRNMKHSQQCFNPNKQCEEQEDSMQKPKSSSALAQSPASITSRVVRNREEANSQELLTAIGQILVEKLGLHHGRAASDLNSYEAEPPEPMGRCSCYHRLPSSPDKRTMVKDRARAHDDSSSERSHPIKRRWVPGRFSNQALLPQEPVPPTSHGHQRPTGRGASNYLRYHPTSSFHRVFF